MTIRILIADDHGVWRAALRSLLRAQEGLEVVGEAEDGGSAVTLAQELRPDLVLLDITMPGASGLQVTPEIKKVAPEAHILILTVHEDETLLQEAVHAGASGYIVKRAIESELLNAIRAVLRGDLYVHPAMMRALVKDLTTDEPKPESDVLDVLTRREVEVLGLIAQGYTNQQIAENLTLSIRTVESHRGNIMSKLGLHNRAELVQYAIRQGLLENG